MRRALIVGAWLLMGGFIAPVAMAQTGADVSGSADATQQAHSGDQTLITVTGCLTRLDDPEQFVLTSAQVRNGPGVSVSASSGGSESTAASGTTGSAPSSASGSAAAGDRPSASGGSVYRVRGLDTTELLPYRDQQVEMQARLEGTASDAARAGASSTSTSIPASGSAATGATPGSPGGASTDATRQSGLRTAPQIRATSIRRIADRCTAGG
jgi:hypothetical protein